MEKNMTQCGKVFLTDRRLLMAMAFCLLSVVGPLNCRLPGHPVPFSFTLHYIIFLSMYFGPKSTVALVGGYLLQGAFGMPVFAGGGAGLAYILGPTGGYLAGYVLSAWAVGYLYTSYSEWRGSFLWIFSLCWVGWLCTVLPGVLYLSFYVGIYKGVALGLVPFILTDLLKSLFVTAMVSARNQTES